MKTQFFLFLMLLLPAVARAYDAKIDGICYNFDKTNKTATVTYQNLDYFNNPVSDYSGTINIPDTIVFNKNTYSVTSIGDGAFQGSSGMTSISIPNSVMSIGNYAFSGCIGLTSIMIPNSVTSIGDKAFWYGGITSITIPNSVTTIGNEVFSDCAGLTSISIPDGVTSIGRHAFNNCTSLSSVSIGNSVTYIGVQAFWKCTALTSITIPNSVTSIENSAFQDCCGLISIKVDDGNTVYDSRNDCNAIIKTETNELISGCMNTIIPSNVTSIGYYAFFGCSGLTSVTIPNSVTSIGDYAFYYCTSLTSVTIGNSVTNIGDRAFAYCSGLTSVTIPNSVTSIGNSAFYQCSGLTSVTIGNSVTSIGSYAFNNCCGLTSVTIPSSVTSIGQYAFNGCNGVMTVKSYINEPFNVTGLFAEETYRQGTLYVPAGTKDLYIRFDGWREFLKIEEMEKEPAPNGECAMPTIIVMGNKFKFQCETPGAEFTSSLTTEENFTGDEVMMDNDKITYVLTVYANAPGYDQSRPAKYRFTVSKKDVNQDGAIDVADIATIIDTMAAQAREQEDVEE